MKKIISLSRFFITGCMAFPLVSCSTNGAPSETDKASAAVTAGKTNNTSSGYSHLNTGPITPEQKTMLSLFGNERFSSTFKGFHKLDAAPYFAPHTRNGARFGTSVEDGHKVFVVQPSRRGGVYFQAHKASDLSAFRSGAIKFEIKTAANPDLVLRLQDDNGNTVDIELKYYLSMNNQWERINIPLTDFGDLDFSRISVPFGLANGTTAILLKNIYWLTDGDASQLFSH